MKSESRYAHLIDSPSADFHPSAFILLPSSYAFFISSCVISSVSTATALLAALSDGPVHFEGHALKKFQRSFSCPVSSMRMIEPFLRSALPEITVARHFHNSSESVMPRLRVTGENLFRPGSLRA